MSDTAPEQNSDDMPINIMAQYVRDLSFENPNTPHALRANMEAPEMDINIGMDARKIEDSEIENFYEVVLNISATALRGEEPVFIAEIQYGVAVQLNGIPEENHHPVLLIEIPAMAFPYARQTLSDMTMKGGYPPLMLNPVDFRAMYMQRFADEIEEAQQTGGIEVEDKPAVKKKPAKGQGKIKPKKETS